MHKPVEMNSALAVAYVSSAVRLLADAELEALLLNARRFNAEHQITGVLLYHEGTFFQYFEGQKSAADLVYARVKKSSQHHGLIELLHERVPQRQFSDWHMGFSTAPNSLLLSLEQANWCNLSTALQTGPSTSAGLGLLLHFWRNTQYGAAWAPGFNHASPPDRRV